jgi:hypothetical protein
VTTTAYARKRLFSGTGRQLLTKGEARTRHKGQDNTCQKPIRSFARSANPWPQSEAIQT